jgi:Domain of unknown function (DUF1887)
MKRMISFISAQPLPNYIPINEDVTRPEVLYGFFTPREKAMELRWKALKEVIGKEFPAIRLEGVEVADEYDGHWIQEKCLALLNEHAQDEWTLNATGGTKLMSASASEVFRQGGRPILYVESTRRHILKINPDWTTAQLDFRNCIELPSYFALFGQEVDSGHPVTGQEDKVQELLRQLQWRVWASVKLKGQVANEYDVIGIDGYEMSVFECKRRSDPTLNPTLTSTAVRRIKERHEDDVLKDLHKLFQVRQRFGGITGKAYWIFSGNYRISPTNEARIRDFNIIVIKRNEINEIARTPEKFRLPLRGNVQFRPRRNNP